MLHGIPEKLGLAQYKGTWTTLEDHSGAIYSIAFTPDGRRLATGGNWEQAVRLWDVSTRRILTTLAAPGSTHEAVQFSPDGNGLLTLNDVGRLRYWCAPSLQAIEAGDYR